jgi:hypothetical protein
MAESWREKAGNSLTRIFLAPTTRSPLLFVWRGSGNGRDGSGGRFVGVGVAVVEDAAGKDLVGSDRKTGIGKSLNG